MSLSYIKLKYYCKVKDGTHDTPAYIDPGEESYPLITSKDINNGEISFIDAKHISEEDYIKINKRSDVEKYDVIMPMIGTIGNPAIVLTDEPFSIKNVALFKTAPNLMRAKYLKYMLDSFIIKQQFDFLNRGGVQTFVSLNILQNLSIIKPNNIEETVNYLDKKTEEIEKLLDNKQQLINLLEEKRQSIITEVVTKGLNPNVKMKDSGVEWIGEIPEHWNMKKVKYLISEKLSYGANESAEIDDPTLPRYIRITDIDANGDLKEETFKSIPFEIANQYEVKKGDILLARSGATVGKSYFHKSEKIASYAGYLIKLRTNSFDLSKYIYYFTNSSVYKSWIQSILIQATIQNVSAEKYANLTIPIPPKHELGKINIYLEKNEIQIRNIIRDIKNQIEKLKEYRQSLIYEAVTGKIDVREMEVDEVR